MMRKGGRSVLVTEVGKGAHGSLRGASGGSTLGNQVVGREGDADGGPCGAQGKGS